MINQDYLYTTVYPNIAAFLPENCSTYIYGFSTEDRSHIVESLILKFNDKVQFVKVEDIGEDYIFDHLSNKKFGLRSQAQMSAFISQYLNNTIYIDVTGLNNRLSASILNNSLKLIDNVKLHNVKVVYMEPDTYKIQEFKAEGVFNDLSETIEGINPLPGFATIYPDQVDNIHFVALLGFEGGRFTHLIENLQPPYENIVPVIGIPGFRPEYPFVAYWGNRKAFEETNSWRKIKFASANSIVDVYLLLKTILEKNPDARIKLAPIGTKPHAIAAMLFAIRHPHNVEIVYDNPKRKKRRTDGVGLIVECFVSKLIQDN